uniref:GOST seven transmembrane domain-containing protein n=1 Tax=Pseudo-nitzschia delicatissima TaxID=44447 RepID=A0A7S0UHF2_9STRA
MNRRRGRRRRRAEASGKQGTGEVTDSVVRDGIFLDMLNTKLWRPRHAYASYDFQPGEEGFYFLMYQVCYKSDDELENGANDKLFDIHTRFELDFHSSNMDRFGRLSYLSRGEMNLPWLFLGFSVMYAVCIYIWHFNIKLIKEGKQGYFDIEGEEGPPTLPGQPEAPSPTIYPIHYLMGVLLTLKFCTLLFEAIRYHFLRVRGHAEFFSFVYYTFAFIKGMSLFTVILLIGSGWSFVKPFLTESEKKMILAVLVLQVINNIAIVFLTQETEGEIAFDNWTAVLHLVDIICCCAVLMPIIWQVNQLEKNMENNEHKGDEGKEEEAFINDQFDDEDNHIPENEFEDIPTGDDDSESDAPIPDARMAAKLKMFRSFYMIVIAYIYMTRIVVYLFSASLNYKHTWVTDFVLELTTVVFYCSVGYMFRPMIENPYLHVPKKPKKKAAVEMRRIDPSTKTALD